MTLEDSGEEVASPEDAGAEAAEEDALEDSGAEAGAREARVLEAGAEQAASIRARTAARRIERFFMKITSIEKEAQEPTGRRSQYLLSKVGWPTPTFLTILRTFLAGRKTQELFVDLPEYSSGVLLSIVHYNWMMISSTFQ